MSDSKMGVGQKMGWVDGQVVPIVSGKITKLYPSKTGQRADETEWSRQGGELLIDTIPIKFNIWDCEEYPQSTKGKNVIISSTKGGRGLAGVKYEINSYTNGKGTEVTEETLKIGITAKIELGSGVDFQDELDGKADSKPKPAAEKRSSGSVGQSDTAEDVIARILALHFLCHKEVNSLYAEEAPETRQAYTASIFIESNKQGAAHLPFKSPTQSPAKAWQNVIMPEGQFEGEKLGELPFEEVKRLYDALKPKGFNTDFKKAIQQAYLDQEWSQDAQDE